MILFDIELGCLSERRRCCATRLSAESFTIVVAVLLLLAFSVNAATSRTLVTKVERVSDGDTMIATPWMWLSDVFPGAWCSEEKRGSLAALEDFLLYL